MIKRELAKDPKLATENWDRFLPKFRRRREKKRGPGAGEGGAAPSGANGIPVNGDASTSTAPAVDGQQPPAKKQKKEKKPYTPFPPAQLPSKVRQLCQLCFVGSFPDALPYASRSTFSSNPASTSSSLGRSSSARSRSALPRSVRTYLGLYVCGGLTCFALAASGGHGRAAGGARQGVRGASRGTRTSSSGRRGRCQEGQEEAQAGRGGVREPVFAVVVTARVFARPVCFRLCISQSLLSPSYGLPRSLLFFARMRVRVQMSCSRRRMRSCLLASRLIVTRAG